MQSPLKKIAEFFASIRLAIILLIILTIVSFFGIVIPQELSADKYIHKLGSILGKALLFVGYDHVFSTYWFYLLLGLFSCSILVCSSTRLWKNTKNSLKKSFLASPESMAQFKHTSKFSAAASCDSAKTAIAGYLKSRLYSVKMQQDGDSYQIVARKGALKDFGSLLFHVSIIILFIGGLVGARFGYSFVKELRGGEITSIPGWPFLLRCDWFKIEQNDQGQVKSYRSKVTVLRQDSMPVLEKIIEVNRPLSYQKIRIYQSSYRQDPHQITDIFLSVRGPAIPQMGFMGSVPYDSLFSLPGSAINIKVTDYIPDFLYDMTAKKASSRSDEANNPAVKVTLTHGKDTLYDHWAFFNYPGQHTEGEKYQVMVNTYTPVIATGLQIRKNPGIPFIFTGIIAMTLGIFAVFYISRRSIWVFVSKNEKNGSNVSISGTSSSVSTAFQNTFDKLVSHLKAKTGNLS